MKKLNQYGVRIKFSDHIMYEFKKWGGYHEK